MAIRRRIHVADSDDFGLGDVELPGGGRILLGRAHDEPTRTPRSSAHGAGAARLASIPTSPAETDASNASNPRLSDRFRGRDSSQRLSRPHVSVSQPRSSSEPNNLQTRKHKQEDKQHSSAQRKEVTAHHSKLHHSFSDGGDGQQLHIKNIPLSFTVVYDDELIIDGSTGQGKIPPNIVDAAVLRRAFKECYKAFTSVVDPAALQPVNPALAMTFKQEHVNVEEEEAEAEAEEGEEHREGRQQGSVKLEERNSSAPRSGSSQRQPRFSGFSFTSPLSCSSEASSSSSDPTYVSEPDSSDDEDEEYEDEGSDIDSDVDHRRHARAARHGTKTKPEERRRGNGTAVRSRNASTLEGGAARKRKRTEESGGDESEYAAWTVGQLKDHLRERGLTVSGNKAALIARIQQANEMESNRSGDAVEGRNEYEYLHPTSARSTVLHMNSTTEEEEERSAVGSFLSARSSAATSVGYGHITTTSSSDGYSFNSFSASAPRRVASAPRSSLPVGDESSDSTGSFSFFRTLANVGSRLFRYSTGSVDSASTQSSQHNDANREHWRRSV